MALTITLAIIPQTSMVVAQKVGSSRYILPKYTQLLNLRPFSSDRNILFLYHNVLSVSLDKLKLLKVSPFVLKHSAFTFSSAFQVYGAILLHGSIGDYPPYSMGRESSYAAILLSKFYVMCADTE